MGTLQMSVPTLGICPEPGARFPFAQDIYESERIAISRERVVPIEGNLIGSRRQRACSSLSSSRIWLELAEPTICARSYSHG
jgi:hypothetical protein